MSSWRVAVKLLGELGGQAKTRQLEFHARTPLPDARFGLNRGLRLGLVEHESHKDSPWRLTALGRQFIAGEVAATRRGSGGGRLAFVPRSTRMPT